VVGRACLCPASRWPILAQPSPVVPAGAGPCPIGAVAIGTTCPGCSVPRLVSFMHYDLGYFDLEQKTLQPLDNPFGTRLSPMS
jgi:hypothetical protein